MARPQQQDSELAVGSDSFLDVVTNIVGILIILVMVAGMRAGRASSNDAAEHPTITDLKTVHASVGQIEQDVHHLDHEMRIVQAEISLRAAERERLGMALAAGERELEARRSRLSDEAREGVQLQQAISAMRHELEMAYAQKQRLLTEPTKVVEVENVPTPLSKTVLGKQVHCRLCGGHVALIPLDELLDKARTQTRDKLQQTMNVSHSVDTTTPVGGFQLRYSVEFQVDPKRGQGMALTRHWQVIPLEYQLGEPVNVAIDPSSEFRRSLAALDPKQTTVTIWTYPDSFDEFRELRKQLYQWGYSVAGRPLPEGTPIAGSPYGSKSAAQ